MYTHVKNIFKYFVGYIFQLSFHSLFQNSYILFSRFPFSAIKINILHVEPNYIHIYVYIVNHISIMLVK